VKIALQRDGLLVSPIVSTLAPQTMRTALGATAVKHSGIVQFPESAFQPDANVHISLIPDSGNNIEIDMPPGRLLILSSPAGSERLSSSLIKLKEDEVVRRLGKPTRVDGHRWSYVTTVGTLAVYLDDSGIVTDVQPKAFDLMAIRR